MRRVQIIGALCLAVVACLVSAVSASAAPTDPFQYQYSFDGSGIPGGIGFPRTIVVNHATGNLLVFQRGEINSSTPKATRSTLRRLASPHERARRRGNGIAKRILSLWPR